MPAAQDKCPKGRRIMKYVAFLSAIALIGCSSKISEKAIGTAISSPLSVVAHGGGNHFYVLNGNLSRVYRDGSILILDTAGNKVKAISTPRVGQFLSVTESGNYLMAGFSSDPETNRKAPAKLQLYDTSNPTEPNLVKTFELDCTPNQAIERGSYIALSCLSGSLYAGKLNGANSTLSKIRESDGFTRRAMHIDTSRNLLYAFVSDLGESTLSDSKQADKFSYNEDYVAVEGANEVPDAFERSRTLSEQNTNLKNTFRFLVYDLAAGEAAGFPVRSNKNAEASKDMRYLYFNLLRSGNAAPGADEKYYRTNFWSAQPDPTDPNVFYLSHRGNSEIAKTPDAAGIVKVTVSGDPRSQGGVVPKTSDHFTFEGFYGYHAGKDLRAYPGEFKYLAINSGSPLLIFNDYRDKILYGENFFRIGAVSTFGGASMEPPAGQKVEKTDTPNALLGLAVTQTGKAMTLSFFADSLIMLDISSTGVITEGKRIQ
jgi:hypothetical protein